MAAGLRGNSLPIPGSITFVCCVFALVFCVQVAAAEPKGDKLMLILLDGFRWDYISKFSPAELPGFNRLLQRGVTPTRGLVPVFPSLSFVNYYSLATGLYAENHGFVDNYMYDERHNGSEFLIGENPEQYYPYWWDDAEPIWIGAVRQGKRAYFWYWPGCEIEIRKRRPNFCIQYLDSPDPSFENFTSALDAAVTVLRNGSADLAGVYLERVDSVGHKYGPDSEELKTAIRTIDGYLLNLQQQLDTLPNVNLMIFSDHGMQRRYDEFTGMINIGQIMSTTLAGDWYHIAGSMSGPVQHIWPNTDKIDKVFNALRSFHPNLTVYKKPDIPERYHFKNHYRVAPIFLVADSGFAIQRNASWTKLSSIGYHGYDPYTVENMAGILLASGPDFKSGATFQQNRLRNVNVYQLMCHLLKLRAEPHNGTWSDVCDGLLDGNACQQGPYVPSRAQPSILHCHSNYCTLSALLMIAIFYKAK